MKALTGVVVTLVLLLVDTYFTPASSKLFTLLDPDTREPCILLDVAFAIDVTAERNHEAIAEKSFTSEDAGITVQGNCGEISSLINLAFPQRINWVLKFTMDEAGQATLDRLVQFTPEKVFGETVPVGDVQTMDDPGTTPLGGASNSYTCSDLDIAIYDPITITTEDFNFTAIVAVERIHAQAFSVIDGNFSTPVDCTQFLSTATVISSATDTTDVTSTSAAPDTTPDTTPEDITTGASSEDTTSSGDTTTAQPTEKPITTEEPKTTEESSTTTENHLTTEMPTATPKTPTTSTTAPPVPDIQKYTVEEGNITCISLEAIIKLHIVYPLKQGGSNTATVQLPSDAITDGNCKLTKRTQNLSIIFYGGWFVQFIFEDKIDQNLQQASQHSNYRLQTVGLEFITDSSIFPGMSWEEGLIIPLSRDSSNFPKVSADQDYFRCNTSLTIEFSSTVSMETADFRFKAFNDDDNQDFDGVESVCSADTSSDKHIGVIVGIVLGAVIVVCFFAYTIMYVVSKRRNAYKNMVESDTWR